MLLETTTNQTTPALHPQRGVTVVRELPADLETPTSVYLKLRGQGPSFLLESVEGGERIARYSFIGVKPRAQYILRGNEIRILEGASERVVPLEEGVDPTYFLQEEMRRFEAMRQAGMPRFIGGLVGYLGYEAVRHFEPTLKPGMKTATAPDGMYLLADTVVAFDHARRSLSLIANVLDGDVEAANRKLDQIQSRIQGTLPPVEAREAMRVCLALEYDPGNVRGDGAGSQRTHCRGRYLPGGAFPTLQPRNLCGAFRRVPRGAPAQPLALYVLF